MTEAEIKTLLFDFHTAHESALSDFLAYCQIVEYEADEQNKVDGDLIESQVKEVMEFLETRD